MYKTAVVTGADRGLGLALCMNLLKNNWHVFAGQFMPGWPELSELRNQYPELLTIVPLDVSSMESVIAVRKIVEQAADHVDMLINNAGIACRDGDIQTGLDLSSSIKVYSTNSLGAVRMAEAFLPLMENGMKRLCFVSSEAGSISVCTRDSQFSYCMSKTALNMAIKILFNDLYPKGYTFRIFHPGWLKSYMRGVKNNDADIEPDVSAEAAVGQFVESRLVEDQLVMLDYKGEAWPF